MSTNRKTLDEGHEIIAEELAASFVEAAQKRGVELGIDGPAFAVAASQVASAHAIVSNMSLHLKPEQLDRFIDKVAEHLRIRVGEMQISRLIGKSQELAKTPEEHARTEAVAKLAAGLFETSSLAEAFAALSPLDAERMREMFPEAAEGDLGMRTHIHRDEDVHGAPLALGMGLPGTPEQQLLRKASVMITALLIGMKVPAPEMAVSYVFTDTETGGKSAVQSINAAALLAEIDILAGPEEH